MLCRSVAAAATPRPTGCCRERRLPSVRTDASQLLFLRCELQHVNTSVAASSGRRPPGPDPCPPRAAPRPLTSPKSFCDFYPSESVTVCVGVAIQALVVAPPWPQGGAELAAVVASVRLRAT